MADIVAEARIAEKFLSEAQVRGKGGRTTQRPHQEREAQLAAARREWQLVGNRQSRLEAWCQYSKLVAENVEELSGCKTAPLDEVRPSFATGPAKLPGFTLMASGVGFCGFGCRVEGLLRA